MRVLTVIVKESVTTDQRESVMRDALPMNLGRYRHLARCPSDISSPDLCMGGYWGAAVGLQSVLS